MRRETCLLFLGIILSVKAADWTIDLEYSLNDFVNSYPLGSIELRRNFDGNYTGTFKASSEKKLGARLLDNKDETYSIRAKSSTQPGETFLTTSDPCLFLQSRLYHIFWVAINPDRQALQTVSVFPDEVPMKRDSEKFTETTANSQLSCAQRTSELVPSIEKRVGDGAPIGFVTVNGKSALPNPDTGSFVQKIEREKRARQHGAETDNRSFIAKYWMYIVPVVIFMLISNVINPDAGGEGGAQ